MQIRCKFRLAEMHCYAGHSGRTLLFRPEYDTTIPEDQRFAKASPTGEFRIYIDNPVALSFFEVGKYYYFDATEVPQSKPAESK